MGFTDWSRLGVSRLAGKGQLGRHALTGLILGLALRFYFCVPVDGIDCRGLQDGQGAVLCSGVRLEVPHRAPEHPGPGGTLNDVVPARLCFSQSIRRILPANLTRHRPFGWQEVPHNRTRGRRGLIQKNRILPSTVLSLTLQPGGAFSNLHQAEHPEGVARGGGQPRIWDVLLPHVVV